jgi:hypothetical protein
MKLQLSTKYVFSLAIKIGAPIVAGDLGHGVRRIIPILSAQRGDQRVELIESLPHSVLHPGGNSAVQRFLAGE